ncbi:TonB-dependent receptor plug domain-containing protein [Sulfurimonas sp.]|uniref:TonB-dependent receptor plug domain-containing protein n=1 Tax=Sulfurimonas sp. TaxID=2022749 RepID=UPI0039E6281E
MKFTHILSAFIFSTVTLVSDDNFMSLIDEISDMATKTKLNIDYQPSVISVLHADKLKKIGIRNLHEALALLPGIETSILHTGWKQVIFRGAYNPDTFIFDKYKLYIDGVDVGSDLYSTSYYYLDFPVELIERIEVLRGSASTVYGTGAFSGAINVITKSSQENSPDKIFASTGSYGYYKGGFVKHLKIDEWNIALDSYYQANNKTMDAGSSFVSDRENDYTRSDYKSLENFDDFSLGLFAQKNDFKLIARYKSEITDNYYGMAEDLEPVTGGYQHNKSAVIELRDRYEIDKDLYIDTKVGLNYYSFEFNSVVVNDYFGAGIKVHHNPTYEQLNSYVDVNINGQFVQNHDWMLGVNVQKIKTLKNVFGTTFRLDKGDGVEVPAGTDSLVYLDGQQGFLKGNNDQLVKSIYFQDIYSISENLDLSLNVRFDDYALFDEMFSYRLAGVYRVNDNNIFKAIYGRSYRVPSYVEAFQAQQEGFKYGHPDLRSELIDTYELAYTYKDTVSVTRANLFYSVMQDVIDSVHNEPVTHLGDYANHRKRNAKGAEIEFNYMFDHGVELMANFSYVQTEFFSPNYYNPVEYQSPEVSEVLSKGYLLYPLSQKLSLNTAWYYSGSKNGYSRDNIGDERTIKATMVVDETMVYRIDGGTMLTFSVKNLFDETILYPSYEQKNNEIKREGRNWLLTYEKQF